MTEKHIPVVEIYDGQIADMRRDGFTLQRIGDKIGVSRERVRQILAKAIRKLNKKVRKNMLKGVYHEG